METAALYLIFDLLERPTVAFLSGSDNSVAGAALKDQTEEEQEECDYGRNVVLPERIIITVVVK